MKKSRFTETQIIKVLKEVDDAGNSVVHRNAVGEKAAFL